jgi:hypothetical protein
MRSASHASGHDGHENPVFPVLSRAAAFHASKAHRPVCQRTSPPPHVGKCKLQAVGWGHVKESRFQCGSRETNEPACRGVLPDPRNRARRPAEPHRVCRRSLEDLGQLPQAGCWRKSASTEGTGQAACRDLVGGAAAALSAIPPCRHEPDRSRRVSSGRFQVILGGAAPRRLAGLAACRIAARARACRAERPGQGGLPVPGRSLGGAPWPGQPGRRSPWR